MGSFYNTSHSGATTDGEECILFFVIANEGDNEVYGLYKPISGPIPCTYADYGRYDLLDGGQEIFDDFAEFIKPQMKVFEQGENPYHDIPANVDLLNWDYTHDLCHEDRFYLNKKDRSIRIQRFVVHKSYYDKVIARWHNFEGKSVETTTSKIYKDVLSYFEDNFKKVKEENYFSMTRDLESKASFLDTQSYSLAYYKKLFNESIQQKAIKEYQLKYIVEAYIFSRFIRGGHFDFFPANYASQDAGENEVLFHSQLLRETVLERHINSIDYLLEWFDDLEEEESEIILKRLESLSKEELIQNDEFIKLVTTKHSRKYHN